jgi:hypothetical protein
MCDDAREKKKKGKKKKGRNVKRNANGFLENVL